MRLVEKGAREKADQERIEEMVCASLRTGVGKLLSQKQLLRLASKPIEQQEALLARLGQGAAADMTLIEMLAGPFSPQHRALFLQGRPLPSRSSRPSRHLNVVPPTARTQPVRIAPTARMVELEAAIFQPNQTILVVAECLAERKRLLEQLTARERKEVCTLQAVAEALHTFPMIVDRYQKIGMLLAPAVCEVLRPTVYANSLRDLWQLAQLPVERQTAVVHLLLDELSPMQTVQRVLNFLKKMDEASERRADDVYYDPRLAVPDPVDEEEHVHTYAGRVARLQAMWKDLEHICVQVRREGPGTGTLQQRQAMLSAVRALQVVGADLVQALEPDAGTRRRNG